MTSPHALLHGSSELHLWAILKKMKPKCHFQKMQINLMKIFEKNILHTNQILFILYAFFVIRGFRLFHAAVSQNYMRS